MKLSELETHINQNADDRSVWEIFSDDPKFIAKMKKLNILPVSAAGSGFTFKIKNSQLTIRKERKQLSAEQKIIAAERMKYARNKKS